MTTSGSGSDWWLCTDIISGLLWGKQLGLYSKWLDWLITLGSYSIQSSCVAIKGKVYFFTQKIATQNQSRILNPTFSYLLIWLARTAAAWWLPGQATCCIASQDKNSFTEPKIKKIISIFGISQTVGWWWWWYWLVTVYIDRDSVANWARAGSLSLWVTSEHKLVESRVDMRGSDTGLVPQRRSYSLSNIFLPIPNIFFFSVIYWKSSSTIQCFA